MKYYAVKKGRHPGIFTSWQETQKEVNGFSGAQFKSFSSMQEAQDYLGNNLEKKVKVPRPNPQKIEFDNDPGENQHLSLSEAIEKIKNKEHYNKTTFEKKKQEDPRMTESSYFATIYTDGGSRNTGVHKGGHVNATDKAAWAYLIKWDDQQVSDAGGEFGATNNKMEQTGLIEAMKKLIELGFNNKKLLFVLDSQYVLNAINKGWLEGWKKRGWKRSTGPLLNVEQWKEIDALLPQFTDATFKWTKGHANNAGNEFVDSALNDYMDNM